MVELVIARYLEDFSWLGKAPVNSIALYNKGLPLPEGVAFNLPNVGREPHTFLYHIVSRWECLASHTAFVQGDPFPHCPNLLDILKVWDWNQAPEGFYPLGNFCHCDAYGMPQHLLPLRETWERLIQSPAPNYYDFVEGGQFIVSLSAIKQHPLAMYERMLRFVSEPAVPGERLSPWQAYCFERFWPYIFK